eukprot:NODE_646_length_1429_cov_376.441776.p1 GENE.NODE_646_length_1429_cov_376.441776~~NODE_646_length_1429_cov_376.441776.p1  ORF type:complete len:203 (+),score=62.67 NODE_646_length_1429_cov_376.441776:314-922(+)
MREGQIHAGPPHTSNEGYAHAKRMLEVSTRLYRDAYGYRWCCIVPTNIYGPHDNFHLRHAHVMPALVHKCYLAKRDGKPFVCAGTGKPLRQFVHSRDVARVVLRLLDLQGEAVGEVPSSVICCGDEDSEVTIREVAEKIADCFDYRDALEQDESKSDGMHRKTATNELLRTLLPPEFRFERLSEGLPEVVQWFKENLDTART